MITAAAPQFRGFLTDFNRTKGGKKKKKERYKNFLPPGGGVGLRRERQSLNLQQIFAGGLQAHAWPC